MICQPGKYFSVDGEKGGLCFNDLNTPKFKFLYNYCKPNLWKILLTYEELRIKFSKLVKFSSICCSYFLNNNKYLNSFEDKSLSLGNFFSLLYIFEGKLMKNLVLNFLTLDINTKIFIIFQLQNYLQHFMIFTYFVITTHKEPCVTFFKFFYQHFKKKKYLEKLIFLNTQHFFINTPKKKFPEKSKFQLSLNSSKNSKYFENFTFSNTLHQKPYGQTGQSLEKKKIQKT
ncbi:hypothetical protein AGLY_006977 [Aphis glycines]|uniref:Uncharacterized protein n=1 Tax=Aphis glycines TaxID=307491 RepID=A0A6G0TPU9_APHGL|nr:hypothetical protein AGLY_006977 [Aphis glycines]